MSRWWNSNSQFASDIEKATSETLPAGSEEISLYLEISDQIRSKSVDPKFAMRILKSRIDHSNPNVQIMALKLTDTCVKNGGSGFLLEIASREFMDNLVSILRSPAGIDEDVKMVILRYIQSWALAVPDTNSPLSYIIHVYQNLKDDDYEFPEPSQNITSKFLDTETPPDWTDSEVCLRCRTPFTFTNRKHHCRNCGGVFCNQCSSKTLSLPHLGINQPVRVCDSCYSLRTKPKGSKSRARNERKFHAKTRKTPSKPATNNEDEDIKRAIELSLKEMPQSREPPSYERPSEANVVISQDQHFTEDEDEELKRAIAISLEEAQKSSQKDDNVTAPNNMNISYPSVPAHTVSTDIRSSPFSGRPSDNPSTLISTADADNITLYATLVQKLKKLPPGSIFTEYQLQELHENMGVMRTRMMRSLGETMSKYNRLIQALQKLQTCMRLNDALIEQRLSSTYAHHYIDSSMDSNRSIEPEPDAISTVRNSSTIPQASSSSVPKIVVDSSPVIENPPSHSGVMGQKDTISSYYSTDTDVSANVMGNRHDEVVFSDTASGEKNTKLNIDESTNYYNTDSIDKVGEPFDEISSGYDDLMNGNDKQGNDIPEVQEASLIEL